MIMKQYTRVYAPIDLDAIRFNMESMKRNLAPGTGILGVVKADGYGHGAVPAAIAMEPYVDGYAAATLEEALMLRRHGISKRILILGVTHKSQYREMLDADIRPTIFTMEQALPLSQLAEARGVTAAVHLALDTGMSRIGMTPDEKGADLATEIAGLPGIYVEGLFTHFARADELDKTSTEEQMERYLHFTELLKERGVEIPIKHCANSAAIINLPHMGFDMVRAGISVYGLYPSDEVDRSRVPLKPAMGLKSFVTYVKENPSRSGSQLWRNLCRRSSHEGSNHSGGIRGWLSAQSFRNRLRADFWKKSADSWPRMYGSVYGRCNRNSGSEGGNAGYFDWKRSGGRNYGGRAGRAVRRLSL